MILVKIGQKQQTLYVGTYTHLVPNSSNIYWSKQRFKQTFRQN
jgi:hypothetical protein